MKPEAQGPVYYHGFDISAQQFPQKQENIQFSVHDITKPFPEEHLNKYDLVHVRLLVVAIDAADYSKAIANISAILSMFRSTFNCRLNLLIYLEPGGFLQWEEIDEESYKSDSNPVIQEIRRCFSTSMAAEGKCFQTSEKIFEECTAAGFEDVVRLAYSSDWDSNLRLDTDERLVAIIETLYAGLLLRSGQVSSDEEAHSRTADLVKQHRAICATGNSHPLKLMRVVAQKPN